MGEGVGGCGGCSGGGGSDGSDDRGGGGGGGGGGGAKRFDVGDYRQIQQKSPLSYVLEY
ncbi:MAG: hypothetical protein GXY06_03380 [Clostridiaceae bacterium]|nr:hypothetical protein [Clostridiaceae bacterium]